MEIVKIQLTKVILTGLIGEVASVVTSILFQVPPPPKIEPTSMINFITQGAILITTLATMFLKLREIYKLKKSNKKSK